MPETMKNMMIYLVSVDVLRSLARRGVDRKILERLNVKNAEKMNCTVVELT